jgi:hypothetical protein
MVNANNDRELIRDRLAQYAYRFDSRDVDGWVGLFTNDGVFEVRIGTDERPVFRAQGPEQLRAFANAAPPLLHHFSNLVFDEVLPDAARTRAMVVGTWMAPDGNPAIYTHGLYEQRWSKADGTWRLSHQLFYSSGYHSAAMSSAAR